MFLVYKPTQPPPALKHHAPKNTRTDSKSNQINMDEEKKQELATEGEEDDDGPPPGFQCIITPRPPQEEKAEADDDEEEEENGPPPGFHSVGPKSPPSLPPDMARSSKQDDIDDDEDGPPPGWEFSTLVNALPNPLSNTTDISDVKTESNDELDEGPPPGWETVLSHQMPPPRTPSLQPSSTVSSNIEMGSKQNITRNDEVLPSVSQGTTTPGHSSPATPLIHQLPSSELPGDKGKKEEEKRSGDKRPTSGLQPVSPRQQLPSTTRPSTPATVASSSERAQLVCGTCRKLCLYPRGAKWVQCPGCREVNFVLEAHDVGQVKCGGCSVLLMYPHGAPAVQCTTCHFVTEIGAHNRRPPLSVQQAQAQRRRRPNRAC